MKTPQQKIFMRFLQLLAALMMVTSAHAQLSGTYTIDPSRAASASNYTSFNDADSDLVYGSRANGATANGKGVNAAVVFNVADGSYNEQIQFTLIKGSSSTNTITFQSASGDSSKVIVYLASSLSATNNYVLKLTGAKYITFSKITFQRTGSSYYSTVINIDGGSNYNTFQNNCVVGTITTNALYNEETLILSSKDNDTGNTFVNNYLRNGSMGIYLVGTIETQTKIQGNIIDSPYFTGIYLTGQTDPEISGNIVRMAASTTVNGIYLYLCTSAKVLKNRVHLSDGHYGFYANTSGGTSSDYQLVANNFITTGGTSATTISYGIYSKKGSYQSYFNNNILSTCAAAGLADILIDSGTNIDIVNNNFINTGTGYAIDLTAKATIGSLDYNNYYISGANLALFKGTAYKTLPKFQTATGKDNNSIQLDPQYVSDFDLHINNYGLFGTGTPLPDVTDDIDGQARNKATPTIGADEISHKVTSCMSGIFTIGATGADYATFNAAVTDLKTYGICGPVTFKIANGIYNEQIEIDSISGTMDTVTFESLSGDSSKVTLAPDSFNALVLYHANNIVFKNMGFANSFISKTASPTGYAELIYSESVNHVSFLNCYIDRAGKNSLAFYDFKGSNLLFNNCNIPASIGEAIGFQYSANATIKGCSLTGNYGIVAYYSSNINITNNQIKATNGIEIWNNTGCVINSNKILHTVYGMELIYSNDIDPLQNMITNNFISIDTNRTAYGIYDLYSRASFYNNSVLLNDTGSASVAMTIYNTDTFNFENNILANTGKGQLYVFYPGTGIAPRIKMDHNDYFFSGIRLGIFNGTTITDLDSLKKYSNNDSNSISVNPQFVSVSDLHVNNDSLNVGLYLSAVPTDIDGQTRRTINPTIGADEILSSTPPVASFTAPASACRADSVHFTDHSTFSGTDSIITWFWSFGDGNTSSSQNPKNRYMSGGTFSVSLIVTTKSGAKDSILHSIFIDSTCVWPGDANANRVANSADVLSIGVAYGDTGSIRPSASTSWYAQPCRNWVDTFANGVNQKNADCNGDGVVDSYDVRVVSLNYGFTHLKKSGLLKGGPTDPVLTFDIPKDSFLVGDTMHVGISLGTLSIPAKNIYGIAFKMSLDSHLVDTSKMTLDISNSWLGTNTNTIHLVKEFFSSGYADVAICRIDHKNISGSGNIGTLNLVVKDDIAGKKLFTKILKMTYLDAMIIDNVENEIPLNLGSDSTVIAQYLGINENTFNANSIAIYPNPAKDMFTVDAKGIKISKLQLINTIGQTVWEESNVSGKKQVSTREFPAGIYILQGVSQNGTFSKKIIIEK